MNPNLRRAHEEEQPFLFSSWLKSYRNAPAVRHMNNEDYFREQASIIRRLLASCDVLVASDPEDDRVIWGFIVYKDARFHYVYVKHILREHGLARLLWERAGGPWQATHLTHAGEAIFRKHEGRLTYNPFFLTAKRDNDEGIQSEVFKLRASGQ